MSTKTPYQEKFINTLKQTDTTVALSGMVINKTAQDFYLDDGTGNIRCISQQPPTTDYIRIFGTLLPVAGEGFTIQVAFLQDFSTVDKKLYQRIKQLLTKNS
ncbi:MAG: hypothetical protein Q7R96_01090 [Nanoarchaeota archaeon]|nr:hypothetical protein [Nanoarchaeota archaeon]